MYPGRTSDLLPVWEYHCAINDVAKHLRRSLANISTMFWQLSVRQTERT